MTNEQRILNIEIELARVKADLWKEAPTLDRQDDNHVNDALNYQQGKKDWEILEYKEKVGPGLIDALLLSTSHIPQYDIWKVRRLSDNTVWNVGDKVLSGTYHVPQSIIRFFTFSGKLIVETNVFILDICRLRPLAIPLFTTADGVQIFDPGADAFCLLVSSKNGDLSDTIAKYKSGYVSEWRESERNHIYSTRAAAEKAYNAWLAEQPVLSLNDISRFIDIGTYGQLEELVKDKIAKR